MFLTLLSIKGSLGIDIFKGDFQTSFHNLYSYITLIETVTKIFVTS